ncbi:conserved domain protein [Treponema primitia ZAS-2]|uniref:Conserved domain protein n=1 Tax=Treponema primitia (strain ATCC BAA-887 / DSM 12427 / ZAS-2) TaxID=545694 RepID=F5YJ00_TREPZ|nr:type II toxin-antitoxin system HicA family toxin [Treponema primitia]AEF84532.1 conserved domain protein [Treponema primitia ZAS-2]
MKRVDLISAISKNGAQFVRHGGGHDVYRQPKTGKQSAVPRHNEIKEYVARSIIRNLS